MDYKKEKGSKMKLFRKNKWLLIEIIIITIFSSIGSRLSVIAETLDSSIVETINLSEEKEATYDIEKTTENTGLESTVPEKKPNEKITDFKIDIESEPTLYHSDDGKQLGMKLKAVPNRSPPWGDSIIFGTREAMDSDNKPFMTASTLTLNSSNGNLSITSNVGNATDDSGSIPTGLIVDYGQTREALNASLYSMSSSNYLNDSNKYLVHSAKGTDRVSEVVGKFPSPKTVKQGDILRAYSNVTMTDRTSKPRIRHMLDTNEYNDVKEGQNEVFYQITNNGYQVLHFNHLYNNRTFEILTSDTQESLEAKLKNKEFLTNVNYSSVEIVKFSEYLDNSKAGNVKGKIQVREKLINGNYVYYDYEVPFTVKDDLKILANPKNQTLNLGSEFSKISPYDLATNVTLGNQPLTKDDYTVSVQNSVSTDTVGNKIAKVLITYKKDTSKTFSLDVTVEVKWGNSVVYGSYDYGGNGRTSAAFTLYTGATPTIIASQGQIDDNLPMHSSYPSQQYYTFNLFDLSNKQIFKMDESSNGDKYIKANGNELKKDKLKEWGTAQNQVVNYGDVVRAWQIETGKNWLYENEQKQAYNDDKKSVYYEITTSGYRPLHFNQLTPKVGNIPIYSTKQYMDEHVTDYIDLKNYSNISVKGFSEYPTTISSGEKKAKILVEEALTTGKKVQYEYEVTINVQPGSLTYTVPKTLTFKEFIKSKSEQIVQRKYSGNLGLSIKDSRGSNVQGNWKLTAKVASNSDTISPYMIYRNEKGIDSYLNGSAVPIYTQEKQINATEPLDVEVSGKWKSTDGILLKVPSKNNLASKEYSTTITWNLVEGP